MPSSEPRGLREQLAGPDIVVAPRIYDALSALIAAQAGFGALYLSGASIAYTRHGSPDIGLKDREGRVWRTRVSVRVDPGGRRNIKNKTSNVQATPLNRKS